MDITPKDAAETKALGIGQRITIALGIVIAAATTLLTSIGGLAWITDNLALLGTGAASLVTGGITAYVAVRRMRLDKLAGSSAPLVAFLLLPLSILLLASGCVAIRADSTGEGASVWALGWGADSTAQLANVAVTGPSTNDSTGVSFDSGSSQQQTAAAFQSLVSLGAALAPILAGHAPGAVSPSASAPQGGDDNADAAPADDGQTAYSADGYGGTPGPTGEGVYGRPACGRCRAYRAAHPDTALINIDTGGHLDDMWAALRLRGFRGSTVALPVQITADGYIQAAK